jgi:hypothetical protein
MILALTILFYAALAFGGVFAGYLWRLAAELRHDPMWRGCTRDE